jgi:hypothetical protein
MYLLNWIKGANPKTTWIEASDNDYLAVANMHSEGLNNLTNEVLGLIDSSVDTSFPTYKNKAVKAVQDLIKGDYPLEVKAMLNYFARIKGAKIKVKDGGGLGGKTMILGTAISNWVDCLSHEAVHTFAYHYIMRSGDIDVMYWHEAYNPEWQAYLTGYLCDGGKWSLQKVLLGNIPVGDYNK